MTAIELTVAAGPLADAVVRRVTSAIAAQVDLPVDRIQDAGLAVDSALDCVSAERVHARVISHDGAVELHLGPVDPRSLEGLAATELPHPGAMLRGVVDAMWVDESAAGGPTVCFRLGDAP